MVFQFHKGQHVEKCLVCGALRKLFGILDRGASSVPGEDILGFWKIFPSLNRCRGHRWQQLHVL